MTTGPMTLDSGRNCSAANLGTLASQGISEVRFAGGTWTFGAERAAVLAIFTAPGLDATGLDALYEESAAGAERTTITAQTSRRSPGARVIGSTPRQASGPRPWSSGHRLAPTSSTS